MHRNGHYGASLLAYAPIGFVVVAAGFLRAAVAGGVLTLALAMVPDWDQRVPNIPHRGPTHTVHFAAVIGALAGLLGAAVGSSVANGAGLAILGGAALGATTGAVSILAHIAADALTPMGVEPFGDDGAHISYGVCRADSTLGNYGLLAIGGAAALGAVVLGRGVHAALPV